MGRDTLCVLTQVSPILPQAITPRPPGKLRRRQKGRPEKQRARQRRALGRKRKQGQATATGIFPIFACHSFGPVMCAEVPPESTATVTGMSTTSNS